MVAWLLVALWVGALIGILNMWWKWHKAPYRVLTVHERCLKRIKTWEEDNRAWDRFLERLMK